MKNILILLLLCSVSCVKKEQIDAKTFVQELFSKKYRYITNIPDEEALKIHQEISKSYSDQGLFAKEMHEAEFIRNVRRKSDLQYTSAIVNTQIVEGSMKKSGDKISFEMKLDFSLPTNQVDIESKEKIITAGLNEYQIELQEKNNSFIILNQVSSYGKAQPKP